MINLEIPKKFGPLVSQARQVATEVFRPISRKYDLAEHEYPKELDMLASLIDGVNAGSDIAGAGAAGVRRESGGGGGANRNGSNLSTVLSVIELCWGDVGLLLTHAAPGPRQLGDRLGCQRGAARPLRGPLGGDGHHRARGRLGLRGDPHDSRARR